MTYDLYSWKYSSAKHSLCCQSDHELKGKFKFQVHRFKYNIKGVTVEVDQLYTYYHTRMLFTTHLITYIH